jgi:hypothetical protein
VEFAEDQNLINLGSASRITRANGTTVFGYDGMQNRAMKAVRTGVDTVFTFYVRDAQGNVMGVYNRITAATPTITWAEQYIIFFLAYS